jgi:hypothetical protein
MDKLFALPGQSIDKRVNQLISQPEKERERKREREKERERKRE